MWKQAFIILYEKTLLKKVHKSESCPSLSKHIIEDSYTETA